MTYTLQLQAHNAHGILERILGVIRYRGFEIMGLVAHLQGLQLAITLELSGQNQHLIHHLRKLIDVQFAHMTERVSSVREAS
ncbi:MAG: acetolactate synthase 2 small subunit [Acidobacteria bacterium]|nr:acetolactate synthase 2 small subunit [Acidobacteriota bacterium]